MSALYHCVEMNNGDMVDVVGWVNFIPQKNGYSHLHPESMNPSVHPMVARCILLYSNNHPLSGLTINQLRVANDIDTFNGSAYQAIAKEVNDNTQWLWGDLYKGGVGLFLNTQSPNRIQVIYSYGECVDNAEHYCYYVQQGSGGTWTPTQYPTAMASTFFAYPYISTNGHMSGLEYVKQSFEPRYYDSYRGYAFAWIFKDSNRANNINSRWQQIGINSFTETDLGEFDSFATVFDQEVAGSQITGSGESAIVTYDVWARCWKNATTANFELIYENPPSPWACTNSSIWGGATVPPQPNKNGGTSGGGGGGGGFDNTTDNDDFTDPSNWIDATDTGFVSLYTPSKTELKSLANFLFTGITASAEITLKKLLANPMDYIVSLNMVHLPLSFTETEVVRFGGISTGVIMGKLGKQFLSIYGGSFDINEQFMTFLDYGKYSTIKISIPYCGIFPLPSDALMGGTLHINYIVDLLTGSLTAELKIVRKRSYVNEANTQRVIATYSGNCFLPLPIASTDYRQTVSALLGITGGLATSIATGNPLSLVGSSANAVVNSKQDINMGGNIGSNYGYMTKQKAFLILERPFQNLPLNFPQYYGYPSNIRFKQLNMISGYIEIDNAKYWAGSVTNSFGRITDSERKELEKIVESGIWISEE